ncbi:MAG: hypothetical protein AMXMBFR47_39820 [Planctomycetota bacterium]
MTKANKTGGIRFVRYMPALLDALRDLGGSGTPAEVADAVARRLALKEADLAKAHPKSGRSVFRNDVAWARNYLNYEGLVDSSERGIWALSGESRTRTLTADEAHEIVRRWVKIHRERRLARDGDPAEDGDPSIEPDHGGIPPNLPVDLLSVIKSLPPAGFERLCQRLLRESGFQEVHVTGRSSDGGIDGHGVLQINALVTFRVLFQCKRYGGAVPPKELRDFRGAMTGRTDKGIFLTTGTFSTEARREAGREGAPPIELVDGERLVALFENLRLGVRPRTVFDVDAAFFDEFREKPPAALGEGQ